MLLRQMKGMGVIDEAVLVAAVLFGQHAGTARGRTDDSTAIV